MTEQLKSSDSFAKKYRPLLLKDLIGQDLAKKQIAGMLKSGRLPCAILLTGATGCGKTTIGRVIARHINRVKDCTPINDIFEYNIGTNGTVDDIRNLVETTKYLPKNKNHKSIYILDEVHKLTKSSASALLKEIEEPPAHVMFILCTNEPDKLLQTLVNRCEKINLSPYNEGDITKLLQKVCLEEKLDIKEEYLKKIAIAGNCQPRECLVTLQRIANILAGGNTLTPEMLEKEISQAFSDSIYEYSNSFLVSLYIKNFSAAIRRIHECGDEAAMLAITLAANRNLLKFFASLESKNFNFTVPYPTLKLKEVLQSKLGNLSLGEIQLRASEVHQLLTDITYQSRNTNMDVVDILLSRVSIFCLTK